MADDRPFVDLQWPAYTPPPPFVPDAIVDMAADAGQQIRAFDPVGPYYLISYCAMGNVALETARQLRAADSNVPIQFLVDTVAADYVEGMSRMDRLLRRLQCTDGVEHNDFSDALYVANRWKRWRPWRRNEVRPDRMRSIVKAYLMPFLLQHVGGHPLAAPDRPVFAEVTSIEAIEGDLR